MPQMRKQDKPPEKEEMKVIKIPDAEFKTMDIRMLKDLRGGAIISARTLIKIVNIKKDMAGVAQWIEHRPANQRVAS